MKLNQESSASYRSRLDRIKDRMTEREEMLTALTTVRWTRRAKAVTIRLSVCLRPSSVRRENKVDHGGLSVRPTVVAR